MAKLIKRDGIGEETLVSEMPQAASGRRGAVIDRDTYEAGREAQQILQRAEAQVGERIEAANTEAEAIVARAREEAEQALQQAREEGLRAGREEGLAGLVEATLRANRQLDALEAEIVPQLKALAMGIARRVIGRELEFHPETIVEIVKQALGDKARQRREITLRVNPADAQMLRESRAELVEVLSRTKDVAIAEDAAVSPHGVIIETEAGVIDAQLETQLDALERLLEALG